MTDVLKPLFESSGKDVQVSATKSDLYSALIVFGTRIVVSRQLTTSNPETVYTCPQGSVFYLFAVKHYLFRDGAGGANCDVYINDNINANNLSHIDLDPGFADREIDSIAFTVPIRLTQTETIKADRSTNSCTTFVTVIGYEIPYDTLTQYYKI